MSDFISRQDVLDVLRNLAFDHMFQCGEYYGEDERQLTIINARKAIDVIEAMPSVELDNQVHLCNSCKYDYPECPAEMSDVIFGNGKGHDNVCACAKFEIKPERKNGEWKPFDLTWGRSVYSCTACGEAMDIPTEMSKPIYNFCPNCGAEMRMRGEE